MKFRVFLERFFEIITHFQKPKSNRVFFNSFSGQYNDNPKYVSIKLFEAHPEFKQYWYISKKSASNDIPPYVTVLKKRNFRFFLIKNSCRFIVENSAGFYLFYSNKKHDFKKKLINKKQFDISTWHGYPFKNIGAAEAENKLWTADTVYTSSNIMLSGSKNLTKLFEKCYLGKLSVVEFGSPRNDLLFIDDKKVVPSLKTKLGLPLNKKIILYAPTYRDNPNDSGIVQLSNINLDILLSTLSIKFGGEWVFVFRVHNMVLLSLKEKCVDLYGSRVFSGNLFDDMAEYLKVSDVLLTDYSGCIFDVMLTDKPCFLYAHDRERYFNSERGVQVDFNLLPYSFCDTFCELINSINKFNPKQNRQRRIQYLRNIGSVEDGHASQRVVDLIVGNIKV